MRCGDETRKCQPSMNSQAWVAIWLHHARCRAERNRVTGWIAVSFSNAVCTCSDAPSAEVRRKREIWNQGTHSCEPERHPPIPGRQFAVRQRSHLQAFSLLQQSIFVADGCARSLGKFTRSSTGAGDSLESSAGHSAGHFGPIRVSCAFVALRVALEGGWSCFAPTLASVSSDQGWRRKKEKERERRD